MNDGLLRDLLVEQIDYDRNNLDYDRCKRYYFLNINDYDEINDLLFLDILNKLFDDDDYDIKQVYRVIRTIIFEIIGVKKIAGNRGDDYPEY